jgi:hypothetical protein
VAGREDRFPGSAGLHLTDGVALLHPEEQVFEAMLDGWRNQQLARNLALSTIGKRATRLRAFLTHADAFSWRWTPQQADEWFGDLRAVRGCAHSSLRSYQDALRSFCSYVTDPAYDWLAECEQRFGTFPIQGGARGQRRGACPGSRVAAGEAGVHPRRAAGFLRLRR